MGHTATKPTEIHSIRLTDIVRWVEVRSLKRSGVELLKRSLAKGVQPGHTLILARTPEGFVGLSGHHRDAAAKELGIESLPAMILDGLPPLDMLRIARQANDAAESVVPTTFVDDAGLVWRELGAGRKQQELADTLGWSREKVRDYAALRKISAQAWSVVGASFEENAPKSGDVHAPKNGATAPEFTEGLLRSILDNTPEQQLELVKALAGGTVTKGGFKARAENYQARNALLAHVMTVFVGADEELMAELLAEVNSGAFDRDWRDSGAEGPKVVKLVESFREKWERKTSIRLLHGDFFDLVKSVSDASVDHVNSDLPYNVSKGEGSDINLPGDLRRRHFGGWDEVPPEQFVAFLRNVALELYRVMKDGASGYLFMSDAYLSHLRDALTEAGFYVSATLVWAKPNTPPKIRQVTWTSAVEFIVYFTKTVGDAAPTTFNWQGQREMFNYFESNLCPDGERVKDNKNATLHGCQKPEAVVERLLTVSTNRGDVVLDGFMGVGTVPAVAKRMGRKCIGIEREQAYYEAAVRRLA